LCCSFDFFGNGTNQGICRLLSDYKPTPQLQKELFWHYQAIAVIHRNAQTSLNSMKPIALLS
jgi:hypothetical protein